MADKYTILKKYFGYDSFREGQEILIDAVLEGRDVLGVMPTGAGKSLCYQVPALLLPGITLVISPLISLMKDQVQALNQAGIHAAYINSSLTEGQTAKALRYAAEGRYKIIYVAPERLETYGFMTFTRQADISMLTVDEAHCISQWGQDFRPSYLKIVRYIEELPKRPIVSAFTATATEAVKEDISCVLGLRDPEVLVTGFDRKNLYFGVEADGKKDRFVLNYVMDHREESGIIYCATRKNVDKLHSRLALEGIAVTKYHAGLESEERQKNQENFIYDKTPVMVATNAFGMGIDKSNVRYVIHYNMPQSMENYYQEAGRAGRDGAPAECILLYSGQDVAINRFLIENKEENSELTREDLAAVRERDEERLRRMNYYCLTSDCLREYILQYFGEQGKGECENCSNCRKEFTRKDVTDKACQVIACVQEMRGRYGINVVAGTLIGGTQAKLREYGVSGYESFGTLRGMTEAGVKQIINKMLLDNILSVTKDKYSLLQTAQGAADVLAGKKRVVIKESKKAVEKDHALAQGERKLPVGAGKRKSDILNSRGLELFYALRSLRMELAREANVPPYIVFSDKTLVDMCVRLPFNKAEMLAVNGVGENKYERYGARFVECITEYTGGVKEKMCFGE